MTDLQTAYERTGFEIVQQTPNLELPVSTAAKFKPESEIDAARFQNTLSRQGYTFIAPHRENNYLSSKVYDPETNEFFHVKVHPRMVRIFPKSEEFSFETFERAVTTIENNLTGLTFVVDDE